MQPIIDSGLQCDVCICRFLFYMMASWPIAMEAGRGPTLYIIIKLNQFSFIPSSSLCLAGPDCS